MSYVRYVKKLLKAALPCLTCLSSLKLVPEHNKMQEKCNETVEEETSLLEHVTDQYKSRDMSERAVEKRVYTLKMDPGRYKTQEIYKIIVGVTVCKFLISRRYKKYMQKLYSSSHTYRCTHQAIHTGMCF